MAKVLLPPGIQSISGRLGDLVFRTFKDGTVRAYTAKRQRRSTKLSDSEIKTRTNFSIISAEVSHRIKQGDKRPRKVIWNEVKLQYQGNMQHSDPIDSNKTPV